MTFFSDPLQPAISSAKCVMDSVSLGRACRSHVSSLSCVTGTRLAVGLSLSPCILDQVLLFVRAILELDHGIEHGSESCHLRAWLGLCSDGFIPGLVDVVDLSLKATFVRGSVW